MAQSLKKSHFDPKANSSNPAKTLFSASRGEKTKIEEAEAHLKFESEDCFVGDFASYRAFTQSFSTFGYMSQSR